MAWKHEGSRHERGYGYIWTKRRIVVLQRDRYLCQPCLRQGRPTPATEVDHIDPKARDGSDDYENLQAICNPCHKAKTKAETSNTRRKLLIGADGWPDEGSVKRWGYSIPDDVKPSNIPVVLVCGPPAAGKTTLAKRLASRGDMIIDLDQFKVKAGGKQWDTRQSIWRKAYKMQDDAIRSLSRRTAGTCYLIVGAATQKERETWAEALGDVSFEVLKTPAETCIERIKAEHRRQDAADGQIKAVLNWWLYN